MMWIYLISRSFLLPIILFTSLTSCFWPAPYQVHLQHEENFEFLVEFEQSDEEMEMLKEDEINSHNLNVDDDKLERLHKHFEKSEHNEPEAVVNLRSYSTFNMPSSNDYKTDEMAQLLGNKSIWIPLPPYYGKIVVDKSHIDKSRAVNTSNPSGPDTTNSNRSTTLQGETEISSLNKSLQDEVQSDYDYMQFKQEYYNEAQEDFQSNQTYNYTNEGKPEETVKDSFDKIIDIKEPKNCSKEEATNFGLQAVECLADDYQHAQSKEAKTKVIWKVVKLICIWLVICCTIVSLLWCKFGWCCCCCVFCSICRPKKIIFNAKKYLAANPPGTVELPDGSIRTFEPSVYEVEAYDSLLQYAREM